MLFKFIPLKIIVCSTGFPEMNAPANCVRDTKIFVIFGKSCRSRRTLF